MATNNNKHIITNANPVTKAIIYSRYFFIIM